MQENLSDTLEKIQQAALEEFSEKSVLKVSSGVPRKSLFFYRFIMLFCSFVLLFSVLFLPVLAVLSSLYPVGTFHYA